MRKNINTRPGKTRTEISLLTVLRMDPQRCKAIVLRKAEDQSGPYKFNAVLEERGVPSLKDGQVLVRIEAAGFNHREVSLRYTSFV